ncbi:hypothetical protein MTO96_011091 [Rhipicephalus appendiculatus]
MPSSSPASQPKPAAENIVGLLVPDVWTKILRYLDAKTLMNVSEAVPELKALAFSPTVLRSVKFEGGVDEACIRKFLQETTRQQPVVEDNPTENVLLVSSIRELRFAKCPTLSSAAILDCADRCSNLRELDCVKCVVEPAQLFVLLSLKLSSVRKLQWSLHEHHRYRARLYGEATMPIRDVPAQQRPLLEAMYVEVAVKCTTVMMLHSFVGRCQSLRHLHVHAVMPEQSDVVGAQHRLGSVDPNMSNIMRLRHRLEHLETWTCTSELEL